MQNQETRQDKDGTLLQLVTFHIGQSEYGQSVTIRVRIIPARVPARKENDADSRKYQ